LNEIVALIVHVREVIVGRAAPLSLASSAAGRGVWHSSGGHPELGENDELEGQIASKDKQHDEQIVHRVSLWYELWSSRVTGYTFNV
jgi:hypothetical protein